MRNLLMLLVVILGTSTMVHAFPAKDVKVVSSKEVKVVKHPKHKSDKKAKSAKSEAPKTETAKVKK